MSRGKVRKVEWEYNGRVKSAWGYTFTKPDGTRVRRAGYGSRAEATEALELERHPVEAKPASSVTLAAALDRYLIEKARKRSIDRDRRIARQLVEALGADTLLTDLTAARISEYRTARMALPIKPQAVNRPLAVLRHLLRLAAEEWEILAEVPRVKTLKEPQGRLRWLTSEEAHRLLEACRQQGGRLADLVTLALYTGMRQGELLDLDWSRVDRSRGVVLLEVTKSGRRREVPLCGAADAALARLGGGEGKVFSKWTTYRSAWYRAVAAAKLENFHFHDLRHTFASWTVQRGGTLPELKDLLGHSSLTMVMRYAHLAPEHLRAAVSRLDDVLAPLAPMALAPRAPMAPMAPRAEAGQMRPDGSGKSAPDQLSPSRSW